MEFKDFRKIFEKGFKKAIAEKDMQPTIDLGKEGNYGREIGEKQIFGIVDETFKKLEELDEQYTYFFK